MSNYIIVKYAKDPNWEYYFTSNPQINGAPLNFSTHLSFAGKKCSIKEYYTSHEEALRDCEIINEANPCGYYGVCPIVK